MPVATEQRASPDALLALAGREGRGHLKIFLGASPGVGKTYAMLSNARTAKADGRDVVVGLVETHGRTDTEAMIAGLEILPRRATAYRNRIGDEFDVDAALARKPQLLLVDEYAHTNVPGSRHPKRWQDVEELLAAGIDVWTTLNIQHLESLNDVIQKITRVRIRETVPDSAFEDADEIVLVDLPPDELLKRLAEGKVYVRDTAQRAVENFFKPQNLAALRELALRRAAERVDSDLIERMQAQAIAGPWAAGERILASVGADAGSPAIVRAAKRLADQMNAPWIAVTVERPGQRLAEASLRKVTDALRLAESLGAETKTLVGTDIPDELLRLARFENVTQIVIGRSRGGFVSELFGRSLPHELLRRAEDIAVHVVTQRDEGPAPPWWARFAVAPHFRWMSFAWATVAVALAIGAGRLLNFITPFPNLSVVFLLAVLFSALRLGIGPAIYASLLSFVAYNFLFIEPLYTLTVARPYELLALGTFLIVSVLTSAAVGQVRNQARSAADRVRATRRLYEFTRRLSGLATPDAVAEGAASEIHTSLGRATVVLLADGNLLKLRAAWPPEDALDAATMTAARWAFTHNEAAGAETGTLPTVPWLFLPLRTARGSAGVVGVAQVPGAAPLDPEAHTLLQTLAEQTGAALDRAALAREIADARTAVETERVRNTLLASISHDFRTPLSSILGSATSLQDYGDKLPAAERTGLLSDIMGEARHLDEMVRNLLAITRIDAGALELRKEWTDLKEIVTRVVNAARRREPERKISVALPAELSLIEADALLVEQALSNVVGNAVSHGGSDAAIVISCSVDAGSISLSVTDDGPGIPADMLAHVFDKFFSGASGARRADGGESTGLGLAITKGIVEAHGGSVRAESPVRQGRGARVTLAFPLGRQP
ncbi:MAG TPA: sensor histidine kinase KdpD [Bauldia sp.]|nr:sensor histidine kinase KdpD [Bauldia sp.]